MAIILIRFSALHLDLGVGWYGEAGAIHYMQHIRSSVSFLIQGASRSVAIGSILSIERIEDSRAACGGSWSST